MGYILKNTSGLINTKLTDTARQKISQGKFNISFFQVGDSEVTYNTQSLRYNQTNSFVLEPSFNAQNSAGVPQSNKENIKYPYYVDGITGNTYGIPFMDSIISPVYNSAAPRGFFQGTTSGSNVLWSATTTNCYAINSNYYVQMNTLNGSNQITVISGNCNDNSVRNYQVGDIITIIFDGSGIDNCDCFSSSTTTTTTTSSTTTTTTNPCTPPILPTTTTTTTCAPITCGPCQPSTTGTCVVDISSCYTILTYRITDVCLDLLTLDRNVPDFTFLNNSYFARTIIYPSGMTEIYDSVTPLIHYPYDVINFESVCTTDQFDVKIWNMNIPWSENPAGLNSNTHKDYKQFGSINYLGSKEYFGYASNSGQTDTSSVFYYNSFKEQVTVKPSEQKAIAIIHYTNQTIDLFYGEKFALEPFDPNNTQDTTGQARNFKLHIPWLMWHKNPECCFGETFYVDPPNSEFEESNLFQVHYLESTKNEDMNTPGIRYYHLWDTHLQTDGKPNRIGKVFPDSKIIIIDDEEIIAAMSYKSNRNWTLPAPKVSLVTPNTCGDETTNPIGILSSSTESLYVTYRLSNTLAYTDSLHCNYYQRILGPNITCNPDESQNVSVRFGGEFNCMNSIVSGNSSCWLTGFTMWLPYVGDTKIGVYFNTTNQLFNGLPIFYNIDTSGNTTNFEFNGVNWDLTDGFSNSEFVFDEQDPLGNFSFNIFGPGTGFTDCTTYQPLVLDICESGLTCTQQTFLPVLSADTIYLYDNQLGDLLLYDGTDWVFSAGGNQIATLTGLTNTDIPVGNWIPVLPYTAITSSEFYDVFTIGCDCTSFTSDPLGPLSSSTIWYADCYGVIQTGTSFYNNFEVCNLTLSGVPVWDLYTGDTVTATTCINACTTTTTTPCPNTFDLEPGFNADKFEIICQKVTGDSRPNSANWKIIDFTPQISAYTINGNIVPSTLTGLTFIINQEIYNSATTYNLNNYIDLTPTNFTGSQLNFGDEYYFYGNLETDIQATIYEMRYKVNLGQVEFQTPSNPTWSSTKDRYITEIGLYDDEKNLMILSKLQSPVKRQGIQQFVVKLDL
jgi:hypothetical protein